MLTLILEKEMEKYSPLDYQYSPPKKDNNFPDDTVVNI